MGRTISGQHFRHLIFTMITGGLMGLIVLYLFPVTMIRRLFINLKRTVYAKKSRENLFVIFVNIPDSAGDFYE